jgi:hypothetical protein
MVTDGRSGFPQCHLGERWADLIGEGSIDCLANDRVLQSTEILVNVANR